ncbi:hypothetical protein ACU5B6_09475 [Moritella viscosa]|uniref:hypothetical protein n=1 Tax=Moritella viscosa TaxID=80854 RepID=UPI00406C887B
METDLVNLNRIIGPAENVSVIGFPFGLSSHGKLPVWATGFMAQELSLISPENPVFLIDCRTRQGNQAHQSLLTVRLAIAMRKKDGKVMFTQTANWTSQISLDSF